MSNPRSGDTSGAVHPFWLRGVVAGPEPYLALAVRVLDHEQWRQVKADERHGFSIGGAGLSAGVEEAMTRRTARPRPR